MLSIPFLPLSLFLHDFYPEPHTWDSGIADQTANGSFCLSGELSGGEPSGG